MFTQCPVWGVPAFWVHFGDPARCAKCQVERARMAAERTAVIPKRNSDD